MNYTQEFLDEVKALYPDWEGLHNAIKNGNPVVGRYLDDAREQGVYYQEILDANSLEELKEKARILKRKNELYTWYMSGRCYTNEAYKRKQLGCPRIYGQNSGDSAVCNAFPCYGVSYIPSCPKFSTGECWNKFDELFLKTK